MRRPFKPARQDGASLIEVLVSIVILSVGLLGVAGLQAAGLRSSYSAYQRSQATLLAEDLMDRIRANRAAALAGNYDRPAFKSPDPTCDPKLAPNGTMAERDLAEWLNELACRLPAGNGQVTRSGTSFTVAIRWNDNRGDIGAASDDSKRETFIFRTSL